MKKPPDRPEAFLCGGDPCPVLFSMPCRFGDCRCLHAVTPRMIAEGVAAAVERGKSRQAVPSE